MILEIAQYLSEKKLAVMLANPMVMVMNFFEFMSFVVGLIYWKKFKNSYLKWFILFLGYNFLNEIVAAVFYVFEWVKYSNIIFFNFRYLIYFVLLFSLFYGQLSNQKFKRATLGLLIVWLVIYAYWFFTNTIWIHFALIPGIVGGFFLMGIILLYFVESINQRSVSGIQTDFFTYLSLGLLLESVVQLPVLITIFVGWSQLTDATDVRNTFFNTIKQVSHIASCFMYLVFMYGFYRSKGPELIY
ncbi:MAG: hypothetical protein CMF36_16935 [Leeuwenhoekiella sp.]|nr:hypothetical protein [Leeuwenhoekiella sp.]MAW96324.1 hypothetical protein [Leeuwenhoekiella sp.]MBA82815.1 hypothetical protein [Leeuwenhoekiella sp.]